MSDVEDVTRRDRPQRIVRRAALIVFAAIAVALVAYAIATGASRQATVDLEMAQQIDEENRAFCQQWGDDPESARFVECTARLDEIRARHKDRLLRDLSPML